MTELAMTPSSAANACLVIPMYNEATVVESVVHRARAAFDHVVCVDDGSADGSAEVARRAGAQVVRHVSNLGQGAALQTGISFGLAHTAALWFVTFDADGQHRIDDALRMLDQARSTGADVILGSRFLGNDSAVPRSRRILLFAGVRFTRLTTRLPVTDTHNGLRVLSRKAAGQIRIRLHGMAHASEILEQISRLGLNYEESPVAIEYTAYSRAKGQSGINALNIVFELLLHKLRAAA